MFTTDRPLAQELSLSLIHICVHRAHLVEVHLAHFAAVHGALGLGDLSVDRRRALFHRIGHVEAVYHRRYVRERGVMVVPVPVLMVGMVVLTMAVFVLVVGMIVLIVAVFVSCLLYTSPRAAALRQAGTEDI